MKKTKRKNKSYHYDVTAFMHHQKATEKRKYKNKKKQITLKLYIQQDYAKVHETVNNKKNRNKSEENAHTSKKKRCE